MTRQEIISIIPKLASDNNFIITSRPSLKYNCIAWAGLHDDIVWWPTPNYLLDGVSRDWPFGIYPDDKLKYLIKVFNKQGYITESDNHNLEDNFRKIALYAKPDNSVNDILDLRFTHAARQLNTGLWTSKLGQQEDIEHSNPYDLECPVYGKLIIILKKKRL